MMMTFEKVGNDFGFKEVKARFSAFADFKMKWSRSSD